MLTYERLRELLHYDPETGVWTWLARTTNRVDVGFVAGSMSRGKVSIRIDGKLHLSHRLAVLYITGDWPSGVVDHVNGDSGDNRWSNLRDVSQRVNLQNRRSPSSNNRTGLLGVSRRNRRFQASIKVDGPRIYLGTFDTPEQAHEAYLAAKRRLHPGNTL